MMTIILLLIGFVFIMFQPMSNVYVEIITWLGFGFAGFMIDGITLMIYNKCKKNKKRRKQGLTNNPKGVIIKVQRKTKRGK